jgi:hypothetical protein
MPLDPEAKVSFVRVGNIGEIIPPTVHLLIGNDPDFNVTLCGQSFGVATGPSRTLTTVQNICMDCWMDFALLYGGEDLTRP